MKKIKDFAEEPDRGLRYSFGRPDGSPFNGDNWDRSALHWDSSRAGWTWGTEYCAYSWGQLCDLFPDWEVTLTEGTLPARPSADDDFVIKDSGVREERGNGFVRDTEAGKMDWTAYLDIDGLEFIPPHWIARLAAHMKKGAEKYGPANWTLAISMDDVARFNRSDLRHGVARRAGDRTEDHAAASWFNVMAAEDTWVRALGGDPTKGDTVQSMTRQSDG